MFHVPKPVNHTKSLRQNGLQIIGSFGIMTPSSKSFVFEVVHEIFKANYFF